MKKLCEYKKFILCFAVCILLYFFTSCGGETEYNDVVETDITLSVTACADENDAIKNMVYYNDICVAWKSPDELVNADNKLFQSGGHLTLYTSEYGLIDIMRMDIIKGSGWVDASYEGLLSNKEVVEELIASLYYYEGATSDTFIADYDKYDKLVTLDDGTVERTVAITNNNYFIDSSYPQHAYIKLAITEDKKCFLAVAGINKNLENSDETAFSIIDSCHFEYR